MARSTYRLLGIALSLSRLSRLLAQIIHSSNHRACLLVSRTEVALQRRATGDQVRFSAAFLQAHHIHL